MIFIQGTRAGRIYERHCRGKTVVMNSATTAAVAVVEVVATAGFVDTKARVRDTNASGVKTGDNRLDRGGIINCYTFYLGPWRHRRLRVTSLDSTRRTRWTAGVACAHNIDSPAPSSPLFCCCIPFNSVHGVKRRGGYVACVSGDDRPTTASPPQSLLFRFFPPIVTCISINPMFPN